MASLYWRLRVKNGYEKFVGLIFWRQVGVERVRIEPGC